MVKVGKDIEPAYPYSLILMYLIQFLKELRYLSFHTFTALFMKLKLRALAKNEKKY